MVSLNLPVYTLFLVIAIVSVSAIQNTKIYHYVSCPEGYSQCNFQCVGRCTDTMESTPEGCETLCSKWCMSRCTAGAKRDIRVGLNPLPSVHELDRGGVMYCGENSLSQCHMSCNFPTHLRIRGMGACVYIHSGFGVECWVCKIAVDPVETLGVN